MQCRENESGRKRKAGQPPWCVADGPAVHKPLSFGGKNSCCNTQRRNVASPGLKSKRFAKIPCARFPAQHHPVVRPSHVRTIVGPVPGTATLRRDIGDSGIPYGWWALAQIPPIALSRDIPRVEKDYHRKGPGEIPSPV